MKAKYDLGECPTNEEWRAHYKCERYEAAENIAAWLESNGHEVTQGQFDNMVRRRMKCDEGESEWELIWFIYNDEMEDAR